MSAAIFGSGISIAQTLWSYFSPVKSPFYSSLALTSVALVLSCGSIAGGRWWAVSIPLYVVLVVVLFLSLESQVSSPRPTIDIKVLVEKIRTSSVEITSLQADLEKLIGDDDRVREYMDQLKFARSLSISSAAMSLAVTAKAVHHQHEVLFWVNFGVCLAQLGVFLLYQFALNLHEPPQLELNFVQLALITTTFLIMASWATIDHARQSGDSPFARQFMFSAIGLYALWAICLGVWLRHLGKVIAGLRQQSKRATG